MPYGVLRVIFALLGISCRLRDDARWDVRRRVASVVSYGVSYVGLETILVGLKPRTDYAGCGLCSCNLLVEANNFCLGAVLLSYLVSELRKPFSSGLEHRTFFQSCELSAIFWFQGIIIPNIGTISICLLEL